MRPEMFIIESLYKEDLEEGRLEGDLISKILRMGGRRPEYYFVKSREQLVARFEQFATSQYRYLHLSCHGSANSFHFYFGSMNFEQFTALVRNKLANRRIFVSLLTAGYKLGQDKPPLPLLSCTAEELALHVIIEEAKYILEEEEVEADFNLFEDVVYQDADFEYLYMDKFDGIEDSEAGAELGIGNLHFDEWFEPFLNASVQVHPYSR